MDGDLTFTVDAEGPEDGAVVLLLHGFPESRLAWRAALPALAEVGFRAIAPDQRGYSPGAQPDPHDLSNYAFDELIDDALRLAGTDRFHLVGHDWGGQVAWGVAAAHPEQLLSLTVMSRPHPQAFRNAMDSSEDQQHRSRHHTAFLEPDAGPKFLANPTVPISEVLQDPEAMEAALAWYRANVQLRAIIGTITVPTLYIWGDQDETVGPEAARGTPDFVSDCRMEVLEGVGHFVMEDAPERAIELMLDHLTS